MNYGSDNDNRDLRRESLIINTFSLLSAKISEGAERSSICRALTTPGSADRALGSGLFAEMVNRTDVYGKALRPAKSFISRLIERSSIVRAVRSAIDLLLCKPLQTFGFFLFFLGVLGCGTGIMGKFGFISTAADTSDMILCLLMALFGMPMTLSRRKLATVFDDSAFFRAIFVNRLGFETQKLKKGERGSSDIFLVFLLAIILAAISVFIPMTRIILFSAELLLTLFVICNPEAGILSCAVLIPIADGKLIAATVMITATGYLLKVLVGKRSLKLTAIDIFAALYFVYRLILMLLGGSGGGSVFAMMCYFLARNLIRSKDLQHRFLSCISLGATVSAAARLVSYIMSMPVFGGRPMPESAAMLSGDELGIYLAAIIPLTAACMLGAGSRRDRLYGFVSLMLSAACIIFVFDSSLWIYAAVMFAVFCFISFRSRLAVIAVSAFALPLIYTLGEAFSVSAPHPGNLIHDIAELSGGAGAIGFGVLFILLLLSLPPAVRMSHKSAVRYSICGCGTLMLIMPLGALMISPSGLIGTQMLFWLSAGCFVSCEKMLERMENADENY